MYYFLLGLIIYSLLLILITENNKILGEILGILILTFITFMIGLRFEVGIDYQNYYLDFDIYYNKFSYEYIYCMLRYIIKVLYNKFYIFTFIIILITNIFIYLGLKKRDIQGKYLILALLIYSSSMAINFMNIMRQGVSIAIFFYASTFIKERKFKEYLIFILLGAGFHLSILILLPLYLFPNLKLKKINFIFTIIVTYFIVYIRLVNSIINFIAYRIPFYSKYYNHPYLLNGDIDLLSLGVLLNVTFFCFLMFVSRDNRTFKFEESYYQLGLLLNIMTIATFLIGRIGVYFLVFGIATIPNMIKSIKDRELRTLLFVLAVIVSVCLYTQTLLINPEPQNLEYKSIFIQNI